MRRRLDLERDVPGDLLLRCIELAEQAPSGGDISSRRRLVIRDSEIKAQLANLYRATCGSGLIESAEQQRETRHPKKRVLAWISQINLHSLKLGSSGVL